MNKEDIKITIPTHTKHFIDDLLIQLEETDPSGLIDFCICFVSTAVDEFPSCLTEHITKLMIKKVRDYYDSPVGISNQ